jgi:hypothetical protein
MKRTLVIVSALALAARAGPSRAQPTVDEFACELRGSIALWKMGAVEMRCVVACQRAVRAGSTTASECVRPYSGQTQGCVNGTQGKTGARVCKACNPDPPECYSGATCQDIGDAFTTTIEGLIDPILAAAYCDDSGSPDQLGPAEGKCRDVVAKYLAAFLAKKARCIGKCHAIEFRSGQPAGTYCNGGTINDPTGKTQACISSLDAKVEAYVDKGCSPALGADPPECHNGRTSSDWVAMAESTLDGQDSTFFCEQ